MRHTHGMETRDLRWFQQVADGVTLTELSELEMTTQPGISRALARLEREVGSPLLQRSGRVLRMTHAGVAFKRHVDALIHELDDGIAAVQQLIDPETGTVSLAFQPSLGTWLVPEMLRAFRADHPHVQFQLQANREGVVPAVGPRTGIDMELTLFRPSERTIGWRQLAREPLYLAVGPGHPLADAAGKRPLGRATGKNAPEGAGEISLAQAAQEPFVVIRPRAALHGLTQDLCARAGFSPDVSFECDDLPTMRAFVGAGLGVAILPAPPASDAAAPSHPVTYLRLTDHGAVREIGLTWSQERRMLPAAELFRDHVLAQATAGFPWDEG